MATAWPEENDISSFETKLSKNSEKTNGLILGISPSTNISEILNLLKELFEFKHIELYRVSQTEAYFEMCKSDYYSFENGLQVFPDLKIKLLNEIAECYEIILPDNLLEEFMTEMRELCGADRISKKILKCTSYQISIIEKFLSKPNNKFKSDSNRRAIIKKTDDIEISSSNFSKNQTNNEIKKYKVKDHADLENDSEFFSKLNLKNDLSSNIRLRFESHHKLNSDAGHLDLILAENDLTNIEADCILCPINIYSSNAISEAIKIKAGQIYTIELQKKIEEYVKSKNELKKIFHLSSGAMNSTARQILHSICPKNWNCPTIKEAYFQIYNMYTKLFGYASNIGIKSLAMSFLGIQDEFEFGMIALYEALNDYLLKKKNLVDCKLNKIYIVALDKEALVIFKDYLENGYDKNILELVFTDENESDSIIMPSEQKVLEKNQSRKDDEKFNSLDKEVEKRNETFCFMCNSTELLIIKSNIVNFKYLKECRESKIRLYGTNSSKKCVSCSIIYELAQIYFRHFDQNEKESIICLKCCVKTFVNSLKKLFCSCCLRDIQGKSNLNKFCSLHHTCDKCTNITLKFAPVSCYFCIFYEFYEKMSQNLNLASNSLSINHHKLNCARDFCHLDFNDNESQITKLAACGHAACKRQNSNNLCSFCSIFRIFEMMKNHHGINVDKIDYAKIENDIRKVRELENKRSFQSYYNNVQNELKTNQTKNHMVQEKNLTLTDENRNEKHEYLTDDEDKIDDKGDETDDQDDVIDENNDETDDNDYETDENDDEIDENDEEIDENDDEIDDSGKNNKIESVNQIKIFEKKSESKNYLEGGVMEIKHLDDNLPGFEDTNTIQLGFFLPNGIQKDCHPKPEQRYHGIMARYFFPNNQKGNELTEKLAKLFERGQLFKIGPSKSNKDEYIVQAAFELKTSKSGGIENNGYPDDGYLERLLSKL